MKLVRYITYVMFSIVGIALLFDLYFVIHGGLKATISMQIWTLSKDWPIVPFTFGVFMGHLFFNRTDIPSRAFFVNLWFAEFGTKYEEERERMIDHMGLL